MRQLAVTTAVLAGLAGAALGEGCELADGMPSPEIEALNQLMLDLKFEDFSKALQAQANMNIDGVLASLTEDYAAGLTGCRTIAQRRDVGGMTQNLVFFRGKSGPLFLYWLYVQTGDEFQLLKFKLDSDLDLMEVLR